ncbi:MAG: phosphatase PAP2 family protein [Cyanosarcina radialis HA8281-LM2]|nr:phosphatase PAP2 family protein [Cyanosarcina radialis HA8281-LM2]
MIWLSTAVVQNQTLAFDNFVLDWLHQYRNPILINIAKLFYLAGEEYSAATVVIFNLAILYWKHRRQEAKALAFGTLGIIIIIDLVLKKLFDRPRPLDYAIEKITGSSYPSGHVSGNFILYFYLAYLLAERFPKLTKYIYSITTLFMLLMGFSVVYLRLHWPTDIIAGYGVGYIWLTISLTILKVSRKNKKN